MNEAKHRALSMIEDGYDLLSVAEDDERRTDGGDDSGPWAIIDRRRHAVERNAQRPERF